MEKINLSLKDYKPLDKYSKFGIVEAVQISQNIIEVTYYDINNKNKYELFVNKNLNKVYNIFNTINDLQKKVALQHFRSEKFKEDLKEVFKGNVTEEKIEGDDFNANQAL